MKRSVNKWYVYNIKGSVVTRKVFILLPTQTYVYHGDDVIGEKSNATEVIDEFRCHLDRFADVLLPATEHQLLEFVHVAFPPLKQLDRAISRRRGRPITVGLQRNSCWSCLGFYHRELILCGDLAGVRLCHVHNGRNSCSTVSRCMLAYISDKVAVVEAVQ